MNTIIAVACVVSCFTPAIPCNYITSTYSEVRMAAAIASDNHVVVALITSPIFTHSDRERLMKKVADSMVAEYGYSSVTVTLDSDIYSAIELGIGDYNGISNRVSTRKNSYKACKI